MKYYGDNLIEVPFIRLGTKVKPRYGGPLSVITVGVSYTMSAELVSATINDVRCWGVCQLIQSSNPPE